MVRRFVAEHAPDLNHADAVVGRCGTVFRTNNDPIPGAFVRLTDILPRKITFLL